MQHKLCHTLTKVSFAAGASSQRGCQESAEDDEVDDSRKSLRLTGDESVSIEGLSDTIKPLSNVPCTITYADGTTKTIQLKCRIDTEIEVEYVKHGGVLHYVLRQLAKSA